MREDKLSQAEKRRVWLAVIQRDGGLCVGCLINGLRQYATEVHHIIHRGQAPDRVVWSERNMVSLCRACHERANGEKEKYRAYLAKVYGDE